MKKKAIASTVVACSLLVGGAVVASNNGFFEGFRIANVLVNGKAVQSDVPAIIMKDRTLIPLRAVSEALNANVSWDDKTKTASVSTVKALPAHIDNPIEVSVRSTYDDKNVAIQFQWKTNKDYFGIFHDVRAYDSSKMTWDKPGTVDEDRVSFILENPADPIVGFDKIGCYAVCHEDMDKMPKNSGKSTSHYIDNSKPGQGTMLDMWHWRGGRAGAMGYAEDTWIKAGKLYSDVEGRQRDAVAGSTTKTLREAGDRFREDQAYGVEWKYNGKDFKLPEYVFDPAKNSGFYFFNDGKNLILGADYKKIFTTGSIEAAQSGKLQQSLIASGANKNALFVKDLPASEKDKIAAQIVDGAMVPRPVIFDYPSDQHDIQTVRSFDAATKIATVTMYRKLDTGSKNDVSLAGLATGTTYNMGFAVHDSNGGQQSHQISLPVKWGKQGSGADIQAMKVTDVKNTDWSSVPAIKKQTFKPGTKSLQHLSDATKHTGGPVIEQVSCKTCHGGTLPVEQYTIPVVK